MKLPFQEEVGTLGDSHQKAQQRFQSRLSKLQKHPELYRRYSDIINAFYQQAQLEQRPLKKCYC